MTNALVEAVVEGFRGPETRLYEITYGDWVQVQTWHNASPSWIESERLAIDPYFSGGVVIQKASVVVMSDGGYIGHFEDIASFWRFLRDYMRAKDWEVVLHSS